MKHQREHASVAPRRRFIGVVAATAILISAFILAPTVATTAPGASAAATDTAASSFETAVPQAPGGPILAADLSQFQPGNIISDAVFFNSSTMSEAQIQAFLQAKVPTCQAGYTCLKDWYDTSRATAADAMCGAYAGGMRERASTIIYKVAQACGINPQVFLVMLQKEQGLVTHTWPSTSRYTIAMGQGCPDTAACDTRYYGFFNQVYGAAWQLKRYANPPGTSQFFTWYAPGKTWNVRFHPNADCGSAPVFIQNQATANLYYYTPYQPNAAALAAGYAEANNLCSAYGNRNFYNYFTDWFGSTQGRTTANDPFGYLELVEATPGEFRVKGWTADPDSADQIQVHVYVRNVGYPTIANAWRPDVATVFPALGTNRGFDFRVPAGGSGDAEICVHAINVGPGWHTLLGCVTKPAMSGSPVGVLESLTFGPNRVSIAGWALDRDTVAPIQVHAYVGGVGHAILADRQRPDLVPHYPEYGAAHGFVADFAASPGTHDFCAYAINAGAGGHTTLGCQRVMLPGAPDLGRAPIGNLESLVQSGSVVTATGWALDPDTADPTAVHLYVGGRGSAVTANQTRGDVARLYPAYGPSHGFTASVTLPPGGGQVCAYAINTVPGNNPNLGCRSFLEYPPAGFLEHVGAVAGGIDLSGWAFDRDSASPIAVHVYVDGVGSAFIADQTRTDVASAYALQGTRYGFRQVIPAGPGNRRVCAYAIDSAGGQNTWIGCREVVVK